MNSDRPNLDQEPGVSGLVTRFAWQIARPGWAALAGLAQWQNRLGQHGRVAWRMLDAVTDHGAGMVLQLPTASRMMRCRDGGSYITRGPQGFRQVRRSWRRLTVVVGLRQGGGSGSTQRFSAVVRWFQWWHL
jgi:hypothetical protein